MGNDKRAGQQRWLITWKDSDKTRIVNDDPMRFRMLAKAVNEGRASVEQMVVPKDDDVPFEHKGREVVRVGQSIVPIADRKAEVEAEEVAEKTRLEEQRREKIAMLDDGIAALRRGKLPRLEGGT